MPKSKSIVGMLFNFIWLLGVAGFVVAFVRLNNMTNLREAYKYSYVKAQEIKECYQIFFDSNYQRTCNLSLRIGSNINTEEEFERWKIENNLQDTSIKFQPKDGVLKPGVELPGFAKLPSHKWDKEFAFEKLNELKIIKNYKDTKFTKGSWRHWKSLVECWDMREETLRNQGNDVKLLDHEKKTVEGFRTACYVKEGKWEDPYSKNKKMKKTEDVEIDHILSIKAAYGSGGAEWSDSEKEEFANDPDNLIIASIKQFNNKNSQTPKDWLPDRKEAHCDYGKAYIYTASKYQLGITNKDKKALEKAISTCPV